MAQTKTAVVQTRLDAELARRLLTQMALIRRFEEKAAEMYALGKIGGFLHLYIGQEAVAVGATSTVLAGPPKPHLAGGTDAVGRVLFTDYLFPFEVTSVLLLVAIVGVMALTKRRA